MHTCAYKTQRMASVFTFLEWYHKDGGKFLSHMVGVEAWVSFVNVETKE
jgi:hypothetical protein